MIAADGAPFLAIGACAALLTAAATGASAQAPAPSTWDAIVRCAAVAADDARHGCYDDVMRKAGYLAKPEALAAERRKRFGIELPKFAPPKPRRAESEVAARPETKAAPSAPAAAVDNPDQTTVTLEKVTLRGDRKLELVTTDGAVWRQVESDPVRPQPTHGQSMVIRRTSFGGYVCTVSRWSTFRCYRNVGALR